MARWKRSERVNRMVDLGAFVKSWAVPIHPDNVTPVAVRRTKYGNINSTGEVGNYDGPAVSKWYADFEQTIEPGVRNLVLLFVHRYEWITYTSCEGHCYDLGLAPTERHVGLLPRTDAELLHIKQTLHPILQAFNRGNWLSAVRLELVPGKLLSETGDMPVLDFFFRRRSFATWRAYFSALEPSYQGCIELLSKKP